MRVALIGGTGVYDPRIFRGGEEKLVKTPYGGPVEVSIGKLEDIDVVFLPRHGKGHALPPHRVNYRANIYALKTLGVERIISTNSVGGSNPDFKPGDIAVPHDFIDFTKSRAGTFYDDEVVHVDVSIPYCNEARKALLEAARAVGKVHDKAVYACTEGPRFETPAEIRMLRILGCDVVGMTGVPEATLAREGEMCYASICTVTNYAAGIAKEKLTATEVMDMVESNTERVKEVLTRAVLQLPKERNCLCGDALKGARVK
jgi:5'-methylthioadenosine phosphorylase